MSSNVLDGKVGVVFGVANKRSIAWAIAQAWAASGAKLFFNYQGERLKENVEELTSTFGSDVPVYPCDVAHDEEIEGFFKQVREKTDRIDLLLHSVAYAPREALEGAVQKGHRPNPLHPLRADHRPPLRRHQAAPHRAQPTG